MSLRIETNAELIPGYRLLERLGAGGFGEVWKAEAPGGLLKAIKIVRGDQRGGDDHNLLAQQELKALRRVQSVRHPYLLSIDRYDIIDGSLVIVTELADGDLWDRWRVFRQSGQSGIPRDVLLRYLAESAEVLDLMHTRYHLQHLDIKPQNLFLIHDHVKVADFGLVKDLHGVQGVITGGVTPFYAAPETFNDVVSRHCDQYSLAIVYQELLTGHRPFAGGSAQQVMVQHLQAVPNVAALPKDDQPIVARALAKAPERRFGSCHEFVQALQEATRGRAARPEPAAVGAVSAEGCAPSLSTKPAALSAPKIEQLGDGVLAPAVVIGIGGLGGEVVRRLRTEFASGRSALDWRHIQLLVIDTDENAFADAEELNDEEILPVPLAPAAHYLNRQSDGQPIIEGWLDPALLGRLPRQPETRGIRAFGRLALADHAVAVGDAIGRRLQAAIDVFPAVIETTGLSPRSDRPRIHLVAHMGGGTGSGLLIDLAYLAQANLTRLGWQASEVCGWLLAPPLSHTTPAEVRSLANTFAALSELRHFAAAETVYEPIGLEHDGQGVTKPPMTSIVVVPASNDAGQLTGVETLVEALLHEFQSPAPLEEPRPSPEFCRTMGAVRFAWPRQAVLGGAAAHAAAALLERWLRSDGDDVAEAVRRRVAEQWADGELDPEHLCRRLQDACQTKLGRSAEDLLADWLGTPDQPPPPSPALVDRALAVEEWVGRPADETGPATPGRLGQALLDAYPSVACEWGERFRALVLHWLDRPGYRLAAAETAVRVLHQSAERWVAHFGPASDEAFRRSTEIRARIAAQPVDAGESSAKRLTLLRSYAQGRFHGMLLGRIAAAYSAAQHHLGAVLEELDACAQTVAAAVSRFRDRETAIAATANSAEAGVLLPEGCRSVGDAIQRVLASLTWDDANAIETEIQRSLESETPTVAELLNSATGAERLERLIGPVFRRYLAPRVDASGVVAALVGACGGADGAVRALATAQSAAQPTLAPPGSGSTRLHLPPGSAGATLAALARRWLAPPLALAEGPPDAILLIRESPPVRLADLPHLGPIGQRAFTLVSRADGFAPHARFDVAEWG